MIRGHQRAAAMLVGLAGLLTGIFAGAAVFAVLSRVHDPAGNDIRRATTAHAPRPRIHPPATVAKAADVESLRRVRSIAAGQLREADRALDACPRGARIRSSAPAVTAWSACARWPVAHLTVNARIDASILFLTAERLPIGRCRSMALGRSNAMRLLAEAAHQLEAGAWNRSRAGREATAQRLASLRRLVRYVSDRLRRGAPGCRRELH